MASKASIRDAQILELYRQRSEAALSATQEKYGRLFYSTAFGILRSNEDAEECVNDTYVKLWGSIPPNEPENLGAFGCRIARNTALNRVRAENAEKRAHSEAVSDELFDCIPQDAPDFADVTALSTALNRFLSSEPPDRRIIFVRRYFYMDTTREIAKLTHMTDAAVRMKLMRLRAKFKKFLKKEGIEG